METSNFIGGMFLCSTQLPSQKEDGLRDVIIERTARFYQTPRFHLPKNRDNLKAETHEKNHCQM